MRILFYLISGFFKVILVVFFRVMEAAFLIIYLVMLNNREIAEGISWGVAVFVLEALYRLFDKKPTKKEILSENHIKSENFMLPDLKTNMIALIRKFEDDIPTVALAKLMNIKTNILLLLPQLEKMSVGDYDLHIVTQTVADYLPKTLIAYANLPKDFAEKHRVNGKTAQDILIEQLEIIDKQIQKIIDGINAENLDTLMIQSEFLKNKFSEKS